jgi:hypothetical protein
MPDPADSFAARAAAAFQFLISDYGFGSPTFRGPLVRAPRMVGDDFEQVRFESDQVFVSIWRCPSRLEWDVEIGSLRQASPKDDGFSVLADLGVLAVPDYQSRRWTPMWPDTLLPRALAERANALKEYGGSALVGDASLFERLLQARSGRVRERWAEQRLADATRKAAAAFRKKDWPEVVTLLAPLSANLSPAQQKKLDYARKQGRPQ